MRTVKIGELKSHLSAHLRLVSSGEEVLVCDRNRPIARIVPVLLPEFATREDRLVAKGVLRESTRPLGESRFVPNPLVPNRPISQDFMDAIWEEERADRA